MKKLLILLLLPLLAHAAPVKLASEGGTFTPTVDTAVTYCVAAGDRCSGHRLVKAGVMTACNNSVFGDTAPGFQKSCFGEAVVTAIAPIVTQPVGTAPVQIADQNQLFTASQDMLVSYCVAIGDRCAPVRSVAMGLTYNCNDSSYTDPAPGVAKHCFAISSWIPVQYCRPSDSDIVAGHWKLLGVDATVSTYYQKLAVWIDRCDKKVKAQYATWDELDQVMAVIFKTDAALKAWTITQPVRNLTPSEQSFKMTAVANYSPHAEVEHLASSVADDRAVYALNADGTRNTHVVNNVRVKAGTLCDIAKRIGTTVYYSVQGKKDMNGIAMGDVYAACVIVSPLLR